MSWKFVIKKYDNQLNVIKETKYACGGCGKKRVKNSDTPATMHDRHGKLIWKNRAYIKIEESL